MKYVAWSIKYPLRLHFHFLPPPSIFLHGTSRQLLHNYANRVETFRKIILCQKGTVLRIAVDLDDDLIRRIMHREVLNKVFLME